MKRMKNNKKPSGLARVSNARLTATKYHLSKKSSDSEDTKRTTNNIVSIPRQDKSKGLQRLIGEKSPVTMTHQRIGVLELDKSIINKCGAERVDIKVEENET
jgi:hypothetical protein